LIDDLSPDDPFEDDPYGDETFERDPLESGSGPDALADADAETLLQRAVDAIASARRAPLSASVLVARDEVLDLLQGALDRLPDELRQARWLLRERDEFLAQRQREADDLVEEVRAQAQRMVQRTEIVRQANQSAQRILDEARDEARRLRHEAEDFCDQRLATFEIVLDRTMKTVQAGRERLRATPMPVAAEPGAPGGARANGLAQDDIDAGGGESGFFDQDET
jgi:vacuolar-type H+-ATPase subunit H